MKRIIVLFLLTVSIIAAQVPDTVKAVSADSIDISAMVKQQIENARNKKWEVSNPVINRGETEIIASAVPAKTVAAGSNYFLTFFSNMSFQYKLFVLLSAAIIGFVTFKRIASTFTKKSTKKLKIKIGMMREEKVGGTKLNPKMLKIRKLLKDNLEIFKQDEKQLAKTARELNVSQGELLLAARLKFHEMKKM